MPSSSPDYRPHFVANSYSAILIPIMSDTLKNAIFHALLSKTKHKKRGIQILELGVMSTSALGHRSWMTPLILSTTSSLIFSSSGLGEM